MKQNILYIISSETPLGECFKIGITNNLEKRLCAIKTGNQYPIKVKYYEVLDDTVNIFKLENWLHSVFGDLRMEGEWFSGNTVKEIRKKIYFYLLK